jgi:protein arginine kinase activator
MERSCDCCPNPAVMHEIVVRDGVKTEVHLCAEHAQERGYLLPTASGPALVVGKLLQQPESSQRAPRAARACEECGATMQGILAQGLCGCPACYAHFERELGAVISRAQAGATVHVGRHPAQAAALVDRAALRNRLARELREAVSREEYERAAQLRDRLHTLGHDAGATDGTHEEASEGAEEEPRS